MTDTIHLGFAVGSGEPIAIPLKNLAVTGQTQESGKTTTLEALVSRSGASALAFVTKRGESSFVGGRRIRPYFRDRADWQFVTSIIDATLQEKNKFLRPWIMKICRTTRTLADVQRAIRDALKTAKGINEGVYTQLDAYLDLIVPEIARAPMAPSLDLAPGVNVMDLAAYSTPMQMLFVQSAIDWVNEHAGATIVVVPEAWEFIPEGKASPVKQSAVDLVRKGSGIGNRIWVDSQDMAGVDKVILRGCPVWLIGVQREANEIKRNLANIPAGIKKPSAAAIAMLDRGQFFACWKDRAVNVYVQPAWMSADEAQAHARGEVPTVRATKPIPAVPPIEDTVTEKEAAQLRETNERLTAENAELRSRLDRLEQATRLAPVSAATITQPNTMSATAPVLARPFALDESFTNEAMYQAFKTRLIEEAPAVLRLVTLKPEMIVEIERKTITISNGSLRARVARVIAAGFIRETRKTGEIKREMERTGGEVNSGNLGTELKKLVVDGFLTAEDEGYREVAGMKVNIVER